MSFRDWPMERKFLFGTLAITLTAIALISAVLIYWEKGSVRDDRLAASETLTGMIASNAAAALVFDDPTVARQILAGASVAPTTRVAALYNAQGRLYAWHPGDVPASALPAQAPGAPLPVFTADTLETFAPVTVEGRRVGTAFLRTDLSAMHARFRWYTAAVLGLSVLAIAVALVLSRAVQRWITDPLVSLSRAAKAIADSGSYTIRAPKVSADEVGELVDAFNRMIEEVESSHRRIQAHAANLEKEVAARTAALRETVSEMESFSYTVSHDLRAPLRGIDTYASALLESGAGRDPEAVEYIQRIQRATGRMNQLIADILAYSRAAKAELPVEAVDLGEVVAAVLRENPQFRAAPVEVEVRAPLGRVMGHPAALGQVFANLIGNAVKFVPKGRTPRVAIWSRCDGGRRTVFVKDNGIGVAAADRARLFRLFERAPGAAGYEGTGVGLSIVKKSVEKMDGRVGVDSAVEEMGSVFWFELNDGG